MNEEEKKEDLKKKKIPCHASYSDSDNSSYLCYFSFSLFLSLSLSLFLSYLPPPPPRKSLQDLLLHPLRQAHFFLNRYSLLNPQCKSLLQSISYCLRQRILQSIIQFPFQMVHDSLLQFMRWLLCQFLFEYLLYSLE